MIPQPDEAYSRFRERIARPLAIIEEDCLLFSDGSANGYRYPLARLRHARDPLYELFGRPWFTEQHAITAATLVRGALDRFQEETLREAEDEERLGGA